MHTAVRERRLWAGPAALPLHQPYHCHTRPPLTTSTPLAAATTAAAHTRIRLSTRLPHRTLPGSYLVLELMVLMLHTTVGFRKAGHALGVPHVEQLAQLFDLLAAELQAVVSLQLGRHLRSHELKVELQGDDRGAWGGVSAGEAAGRWSAALTGGDANWRWPPSMTAMACSNNRQQVLAAHMPCHTNGRLGGQRVQPAIAAEDSDHHQHVAVALVTPCS